MTETTATPLASPRPLLRDPDDRMIGGVCAAVGRYTDTDPVIWRIATGVLAVFGGAGLVLYALGWLLIPQIGADRCIAERWLHRRHRFSPVVIAVIAGVALLLFAGADDGDGLVAVAVLAGVGYLVYRQRQGRPLLPPYVPPVPSGDSAPPAPVAGWPTPPDGTPRPRSRLGWVTLSLAALVSGVLVLLRTYGVEELSPSRILAVALVIVGAGLVVGTWFGRARWLLGIGVLLAIALAGAAVTDASNGALRGGIGERTWTADPGRPSQGFRLGIGEATLDLRGLPADGRHLSLQAHIGVGHLIVLVPDDVSIRVHAQAELGDVTEFGESLTEGEDVERTRSYGPPGDPRVEVEASVGAGQVEVRRG